MKNLPNFPQFSSQDIDMKLGTVTKLDNTNTTTSKKNDDDVMLVNYDVFLFF